MLNEISQKQHVLSYFNAFKKAQLACRIMITRSWEEGGDTE
jgi:hypothetical protein